VLLLRAQTAEVTSSADSVAHASMSVINNDDRRSSELQPPRLTADHASPASSSGHLSTPLEGGGWVDDCPGDRVMVHRCRSDNTLSTVSVQRAGGCKAIDRPRNHEIHQSHPALLGRFSLSKQHRVLVEINR